MGSRMIALQLAAFLAPVFLTGCEQQSTEPNPVSEQAAAATKTTASVAPKPMQEKCELLMGWDPWEPYHYRDIGGEVRGLDIELVAAIAREAGCSLRFDQEDWATLLGRLREGRVDLLSGASRTRERESFAWFTEPYRTESFRLYVRSGEADKFSTDNLEKVLEQGHKIGITMDYVYGEEINALQDNPKFAAQFDDVAFGEVNVNKLLDFEIDGFLEDGFVAASIIRKKGLEDQIEELPLVVRDGEVHLMLSKASVTEEQIERLNSALAAIKQSGAYQSIISRYLN